MEESIRLGNGDNVVLNILGSPERMFLGEGGYGTVITTPDQIHLALKISKGLGMCPEWSLEYETQSLIYDNYDSRNRAVRVVEPLQFAFIEGNRCYILMQRVCPPRGLSEIEAVHALLGEINTDKTFSGRGRFIGQSLLEEYVDLERVSVDLGVFLAMVHFKLGLDALDLEYVLGRRCGSDIKTWINVIDFGMVQEYDRRRASNSIVDVAYFPNLEACEYEDCTSSQQSRNEVLGSLFEDSYIMEAGKYGMSEEAERVLELTRI